MADDQDFAAELLAATGAHAFERDASGAFLPLGDAPATLRRLVDGALTDRDGHGFLGSFLQRAESAWRTDDEPPLQSGPWHEEVASGALVLEATAARREGRCFLILRDVGREHERRQQLLQTAREALLESERLAREMQLRDLLLHAIVHDLGGPLTSLQASLHLLRDPELGSAERAELQDILARSVDRLREMQAEVLAGFREELRTLDPGPASSPAGPPDLLACTLKAVDALKPAARTRGIALACEPPSASGPWISTGESSRLERVIANLIENALRHAPEGSEVRVVLESDERNLEASVRDSGPGVPAELAPNLFLRGTQGGSSPGQAGLGLYFVRLTIERWGGQVGYEPSREGGSRFWIRLPRRSAVAAGHAG